MEEKKVVMVRLPAEVIIPSGHSDENCPYVKDNSKMGSVALIAVVCAYVWIFWDKIIEWVLSF